MIFEQEVSIYEKDATTKRFRANETSIDIIQGKISALISESEIIELQNGNTTMYSRLANAEMTVSNLQIDFSDIATKYNTVLGQYTDMDSKVAQYKASVDGLSANLTKVSAKLDTDYSSTVQMNTAISAAASEVKIELSNTMAETLLGYSTTSQMNTAISAAVGKLELSVSQKYATQDEMGKANSKLTILSSSISSKVEKDGIISAINQNAESVKINADKISLEGIITANSKFKILTDGSVSATGGKIGGWNIYDTGLCSNNNKIKLYEDGRIKIGEVTITNESNACVIKNGLHVYAGTDLFSDGSDLIKLFNLYHVTSGGQLVFDKDGATVSYLSSSSKRYKEHIADMTIQEAEKILDVPVVWFKYKEGYLNKKDTLYGKKIPGFYAEDMYFYFPEAAQLNEQGLPEDWNYRVVIPAMMRVIQEMNQEIKKLKER